MNKIPQICVGDILEMKKEHPCGGKRMKVMRVGSDIRIICEKCVHDMTVPRIKLEKNIKKIISGGSNHE